jgi:hypothetical protein
MPLPVVLNPNAQDHLERARHNYRLYQQLKDGGEFLDWALTLLFYTALHLVQAYACQHGPWEPADHGQRRDYIRERLRRIFFDYRDLQDRSENMRYDLWMAAPDEVQEWHDQQFARIAAYLGSATRGIRLH